MSDQLISKLEHTSLPVEKSVNKPVLPSSETVPLGSKEQEIIKRIAKDGDEDEVIKDIAMGTSEHTTDTQTQPEKPNIFKKDARELLFQLGQGYYSAEAEAIIKEVGYDEVKVRLRLEQMARDNPEDYRYFLNTLRSNFRKSEVDVEDTFSLFDSSHPQDLSHEQRKQVIQQKIFKIDSESNPETAVKEIHDVFPSGNYLVHGTSVEGALAIISDGSIKSLAERNKGGKQNKGQGGYAGVSFSYDGIGAIPGTAKHMVAFITSPETVLDGSTKFTVPYLAAANELQLVPLAYKKDDVAQVEAQSEFMGITPESIMGDTGFIADFDNLEESVKSGKGNSSVERDLAKLKAGEIKIEDIQSQYRYENDELIVNPAVNEGEISAGIIYVDFLLKYTEAGRALGKSLLDVTPQDLLNLNSATFEDTRAVIKKISQKSTEIDGYGGVSIPIEQLIMLVPDTDLNNWINSLARVSRLPKAIITYPHLEGPNIPNWKLPEGHREKAEEIISGALAQAKVPNPSLPYDKVLGKPQTEGDLRGKTIKYINWDTVKNSNDIVRGADNKPTLISSSLE